MQGLRQGDEAARIAGGECTAALVEPGDPQNAAVGLDKGLSDCEISHDDASLRQCGDGRVR